MLVGGAALVALLLDGNNQSTIPPDTPKSIIEQIGRRDIWIAQPDTFKSVESLPDRPALDIKLPVDAKTLQPIVITPHQLALHGSDYEGKDVVLVGRVIEDISLKPLDAHDKLSERAGLDHEVRLAGNRDSGAYVGVLASRPVATPRRGETVWVIGRVAAVGLAETLSDRRLRAAYFVAADGFHRSPDETLPRNLQRSLRSQATRKLKP